MLPKSPDPSPPQYSHVNFPDETKLRIAFNTEKNPELEELCLRFRGSIATPESIADSVHGVVGSTIDLSEPGIGATLDAAFQQIIEDADLLQRVKDCISRLSEKDPFVADLVNDVVAEYQGTRGRDKVRKAVIAITKEALYRANERLVNGRIHTIEAARKEVADMVRAQMKQMEEIELAEELGPWNPMQTI